MASIETLPLHGATVLVRADFNVPLDDKGQITDDTRIVSTLPTIRYLLGQPCRVVLMSHLGRPEGKKDPKYSLKPVAERLSKLIDRPVKLAFDCIGEDVEAQVASLKPGELLLLENLRFHPEEEKPQQNPQFAESLAKLGAFYINDAFGCSHRAHASIVDLALKFPGKNAPGFLLRKEIEFLGSKFAEPEHPFLALIGGAKVSSKLGVLNSLLSKVDTLAIGGGMAFTFLMAQGINIGDSLIEKEKIAEAEALIQSCRQTKKELLLPVDVLGVSSAAPDQVKIFSLKEGIPPGYKGLDIGPATIELFTRAIKKSNMVLWNGPMGLFENKLFSKGTEKIAEALISSKGITIAAGGDTLAALQGKQGVEKISHLSTGGGASLEYIELGTLPGIQALRSGS